MVAACPTCGALVGAERLIGSPIKQKIVQFVRTHPNCTTEQVHARVYGGMDMPPDKSVVKVHVSQINKVLKIHKLQIKGTNGRYNCYTLIRLET